MGGGEQHGSNPALSTLFTTSKASDMPSLMSLPPEILTQILGYAYLPDRIIVSNNGHQAVLHYWSYSPKLSYHRFHPSRFAINRVIYSEVWRMFKAARAVWHFDNVWTASMMLFPKSRAVIPPAVQESIQHISIAYRAGPETVHSIHPIPTPSYRQTKNMICGLKQNPALQVVEIALPWPDWDHEVQVVKDQGHQRDHFEHYYEEDISSTLPRSPGIKVLGPSEREKEHPWSDHQIAAQVLADLCWQGIETRCWLWGLPIESTNLSHLQTTLSRSSTNSDGVVQIGHQQNSQSIELHWHSMSGSSSPVTVTHSRGFYEGVGYKAVDTIFQAMDPSDELWKHRMLIRALIRIMGYILGKGRVRFRMPISGDRYTGVRPLIVVS